MPASIPEFVWYLFGLAVAALAWFVANWGVRHDKRVDTLAVLVAAHDRDLAVMKNDQAHLLENLKTMLARLEAHIAGEEDFWKRNDDSLREILVRLGQVETRQEGPPARPRRKKA